MNPILNQMFNSNMGNFFNLFRSLKNAKNPNSMFQTIMQTNPQLKQTVDFINKNGGNAKQLFYKITQQNGVDPNTIINQLNNI